MAAKKKKRKGSWNYRVIRTITDGGYVWLAVHEVYYTPLGKPTMVTENAIAPAGETKKEVRATLKQMMRAAREPILEMKDLVSGSK